MKNILYITTDLNFVSGTKAGGSVVQISHLTILTNLGFNIQILLLDSGNQKLKVSSLIKNYRKIEFNGSFFNVDKLNLSYKSDLKKGFFFNALNILFNPTKYYYSFVNSSNLNIFNTYLESFKFDFIWAQWFYAGLLSGYSNTNKKIFYIHHDWQYKLVKFKKSLGLKTSILKFSKMRVEKSMIKKFDAIISVSNTDKDYFLSKRIKSLYLPTTYKSEKISHNKPKEKPSIIHLGSLNTTANRVGLNNFIKHSWQLIKKKIPNIKLEIIGELPTNDLFLVDILKNDKNIIIHNFVEDLKTVIFPEDIHIIPWDKNTGTRTRVPLIFLYKQCLVAMKKGVEGIAEINDLNAISSASWVDFSNSIIDLYSDRNKRVEISHNAYLDFEKKFTHKSQQNKTLNFINTIID